MICTYGNNSSMHPLWRFSAVDGSVAVRAQHPGSIQSHRLPSVVVHSHIQLVKGLEVVTHLTSLH